VWRRRKVAVSLRGERGRLRAGREYLAKAGPLLKPGPRNAAAVARRRPKISSFVILTRGSVSRRTFFALFLVEASRVMLE